jgi:ribosome-associated protein
MQINAEVSIGFDQIEWSAIRSSGPGGQNVNKVSSAVQLRFNLLASSLPESFKQRLMVLNDQRITQDGIIIIKAQNSRSQVHNKADAMRKLQRLLQSVASEPLVRHATKPTRSSQLRRVESKVKRGQDKALRGRVLD